MSLSCHNNSIIVHYMVYLVSLVAPLVELGSGHRAYHTVIAGDVLTLYVTITIFNVPLTSITWTHEGNTLTGSEGRVIIVTSAMLPATSGPVISSLQVIAVEEGDAGVYTAIASYHSLSTTVQFDTKIPGEL